LTSFCPAEQLLAAVTVSANVVECVPDDAVPVIVTVYVPAGVELDVPIARLDDEPDDTEAGENVAVAPEGRPDALSDTVCDEPDVVAVETVADVLPPAVTLPEFGLTATEKSFAGAVVTVRVSVVVCDPVVPVPVIVTGYVPVAVEDATASVSVDDEPDVTVLGENDAVAPLGNPLALNDTDSALPEVTAVETVAVPFDPRATLTEVGLTAIEKSLVVDVGPKAATPLGVPRPVGPSYPTSAVHR
jgi:hypothetical protein